MGTTLTRRVLPVVTAVAALGAVGALLPGPAGAAGGRITCTAVIGYDAAPSDASLYSRTFTVTAAAPFVDDRSTTLRQEEFTATVVADDVQVTYFKDVNVVDNIDLAVTVPMDRSRGRATGVSRFSTSNQPNHTTSYTVTCSR